MVDVARELAETYHRDMGDTGYAWEHTSESVRDHWRAVADQAPRVLHLARIEDLAKALYSQWRQGMCEGQHGTGTIYPDWANVWPATRDIWLTLARRVDRGV